MPASHQEGRVAAAIFAVLSLILTAMIVVGSTAPFDFQRLPIRITIDDFVSLMTKPSTAIRGDWSLNAFALMPLSFSVMAAIESLVRGNRLVARACALGLTLPFCAMLTLSVELAQMWLPSRDSSRSDVLAQFLGGAVGICCWLIAGRSVSSWANSLRFRLSPQDRVVWILSAYLVCMLIYALFPLDVVTSTSELIDKLKSGRVELIPFTNRAGTFEERIYGYLAAVGKWIPVGVLAVLGWRTDRDAHSQRRALWLGGLLVVSMEAAQLFVLSRFTTSTDVVLGTIGIAIGVVAVRYVRRGRVDAERSTVHDRAAIRWVARWVLIAAAYCLFLTVLFWAPFDFSTEGSFVKPRLQEFFQGAPRALASGSNIGKVIAMLRKVVWFLPLGILLGLAALHPAVTVRMRITLRIVACFAVTLVAAVVEGGQILLPQRTASVIDLPVFIFGGLAGIGITCLVWRRGAQERPEGEAGESAS